VIACLLEVSKLEHPGLVFPKDCVCAVLLVCENIWCEIRHDSNLGDQDSFLFGTLSWFVMPFNEIGFPALFKIIMEDHI
jgi:hypothetical protein